MPFDPSDTTPEDPVMIEQPYPPRRKRALPDAPEGERLLGLLKTWLAFEGKDVEAPWFNNVRMKLSDLPAMDVDHRTIYECMDRYVFERFIQEKEVYPDPILATEFAPYGQVFGCVGIRAEPDGDRPVEHSIEDVLLTLHAYRRLADTVEQANPDLVLYFFRGGVPPAMAVLELLDLRARDGRAGARQIMERFYWLPGLGHGHGVVGCSPEDAFSETIRAALERPGEGPLKLFIMDVSFTGSTAISLPYAHLSGLASDGADLDVTHAVLVPIEENTKRSYEDAGQPKRPNDVVIPELTDGRGRAMRLALPARSASLNYRLRVFPVRRSLTEDNDRTAELEYLAPRNDLPAYGLRPATARIVLRHGEERVEIDLEDRRDTVHGWLLSEFNAQQLERALHDLGLPRDRSEAIDELLNGADFAQYRYQPIDVAQRE